MLKKRFIAFFCLILLLAVKTYASEDFRTDYIITYQIDPDGIANVTHDVTITNLKEDYIATNYTIGLKQMDIFDASAEDDNGKVDVIQTNDASLTSLHVNFTKFAIGEGTQNRIKIRYKTRSIATKNGEVWNINMPGVQSSDKTSSYTITLIVPQAFGPKLFISPSPTLQKMNEVSSTYSFSGEQLLNKNITASFGYNQLLNFRLKYQIENPNRFSSNYEIALPPDIHKTQQVQYENLSPTPKKIFEDKDGNIMAVYNLKPKQSMDVTLKGSVKLFSTQINTNESGMVGQIPKELTKIFTDQQQFWQTKDASINELVKKLYFPQQSVVRNANNIYTYLTENYNYDFSIAKKDLVNRKGAVDALAAKEGWGCMEFTDTFITIARAMGIPARELNGYAINAIENIKPLSLTLKSGDLLHAWPEFYDPNLGWIQIDPTWGNTSKSDYFNKLDTNHFVFVRKGLNSDYPLPAGAYRTGSTEKLVEVGFSENEDQNVFDQNFTLTKLPTLNLIQLARGNQKYKVTNTGKTVLYNSTGEKILPAKSFSIYLEKGAKSFSMKNTFGDAVTKNLH